MLTEIKEKETRQDIFFFFYFFFFFPLPFDTLHTLFCLFASCFFLLLFASPCFFLLLLASF